MTDLARAVRRRIPQGYTVILHPAEGSMAESIEIREPRRRKGPRAELARLHTILAMRAAGIRPAGRKAKRLP